MSYTCPVCDKNIGCNHDFDRYSVIVYSDGVVSVYRRHDDNVNVNVMFLFELDCPKRLDDKYLDTVALLK
jgi:hypothetical protein